MDMKYISPSLHPFVHSGDPSGDQPSDSPCGISDLRDHNGHLADCRPVYLPPGFSPYGPYENDGRPLTFGESLGIFAAILISVAIFATAVFVVVGSIWP